MQVFLIRHPQPNVDKGICYGQTDLSLASHPQELAGQLLDSLPANIAVYSSPLRRCHELAALLHPQPMLDDRLKEMHFGQWEMQTWQTIPRQQMNAWVDDPLGYVIPDGESVRQVKQRVLSFMQEKSGRHESMVMVTHAGIMKIMYGIQGNIPPSGWLPMPFDYGEMLCLQWPD